MQVSSLSADFDLSSDETDGEGEAFEISESDEDESTATSRGATASGAAAKTSAAVGTAGVAGEPPDPALQLALRIQKKMLAVGVKSKSSVSQLLTAALTALTVTRSKGNRTPTCLPFALAVCVGCSAMSSPGGDRDGADPCADRD